MSQNLENLAQKALEAAKHAGAEAADTIAMHGTSVSIEVRNGALEQAERSEGTDLGLRVFVGQRQANVSISDTSDAAVMEMAQRAVAMAREAPLDPYIGLADKEQLAIAWDLDALEMCDPSLEPEPAALQQDAITAESAAQSIQGVTQVQAAGAGYGRTRMHLAASNGFSGGYERTSRSVSCVAIAGSGTGMERDYDGDSRTFQNDLRSPEEIGRSAGERAVERLDAQAPATGAYPVLFDERVSSSLIGHLLAAVNGSMIARGASWARDLLEQQVLPAGLSVTEDPHRPRISGTRPFDAEGLPTKSREIIRDGVLTGWTLDLGTARKLGMASTGNAARGVSSPPSPSTWNIALTQGSQSREALLRDMGTGLLVTSLIGSTINPNTGDYSRGAAGFWVENGQLVRPVNQCTIAGNLRDMLGTIVPANDARSYLSRVVPSLLVEGLTLAGS